MTSWLADENFNANLLRGLSARIGLIDLTTVENEGMRRAADPVILAWPRVTVVPC